MPFSWDSAGPVGSIVINGGAQYTNSGTVTLTLAATDSGSGQDKVLLRNENGTYNEYAYNLTISDWVILSPGDGAKKVYAKFKDKAGNISSEYLANITLNTTEISTNRRP